MEKNVLALFEINVPKTAKTLAKFVSKDTIRPQLCGVCIAPAAGYMAATDLLKLRLCKIEAIGEHPEGLRVLVEPAHVAKIAGKTVTVTVSEFGPRRETVIECEGETYTTQTGMFNIPDFRRVVPAKENRRAIQLTPESVNALKTICKLHKASGFIAFDIVEGCDTITVYDEVKSELENRALYTLKLAAPSELTTTLCQDVNRLADCLNGCNGTITFHSTNPEGTPITYEGEADATILVPARVSDETAEFIKANRSNISTPQTSFADDAAEVLAQLQSEAAELWQSIVRYNSEPRHGKQLIPGNYTAKDIASRDTAKCGQYAFPDYTAYTFNLEVNIGNINLTVDYADLFSILAAWEAAVRCKKSVFAVGDVEEITATVLNIEGENVVEKKTKLRVLGDGWYCDAKRNEYSYDTELYFEFNGVFIPIRRIAWGTIDDEYSWGQFVNGKAEQIPGLLAAQVNTRGCWAEIARRCGIAPQSTETPQMEKKQTKYRFKQSEIEAMKESIIFHCEFNKNAGVCNEYTCYNEYTALSLRRYFEGYIREFAEGSKYRKFYERKLALYTMLTENDMPNFVPQATETPQISTEAAKVDNCATEGGKTPETQNLGTTPYTEAQILNMDARVRQNGERLVAVNADGWCIIQCEVKHTPMQTSGMFYVVKFYGDFDKPGGTGLGYSYNRAIKSSGNTRVPEYRNLNYLFKKLGQCTDVWRLCNKNNPINAPQSTQSTEPSNSPTEGEKSGETEDIELLRTAKDSVGQFCRKILWWNIREPGTVEMITEGLPRCYSTTLYHCGVIESEGRWSLQSCLDYYGITETDLRDLDTYLAEAENKPPQPPETPPAKDLSTEPEKRDTAHGKRQNPVIKDCLITDRPLLQRGRYGCRVKSVLFHAAAVFHGECSTHIVPRIFGECSTVVATNKRQADRQADRQAPLLANQTITPCRDKRTDKRRDKQATSNSPPYW